MHKKPLRNWLIDFCIQAVTLCFLSLRFDRVTRTICVLDVPLGQNCFEASNTGPQVVASYPGQAAWLQIQVLVFEQWKVFEGLLKSLLNPTECESLGNDSF